MAKNSTQRQTFAIKITHNEHHSWQGVITHFETGEAFTFRSAMEMLLLMNTILDSDKNETDILQQRRYRTIRTPGVTIGI